MKQLPLRWSLFLSFVVLASTCACAQTVTVEPRLNADGLLRNPATGWTLYLETFPLPAFPSAEQSWADNTPYLPDLPASSGWTLLGDVRVGP